ncbi:MAG: hypothetical protein MZV63_44595 [Marinilabiliales bacterium]|nr:hypothetical protein [Marinilabiliales bacterium]
MVYKWDGKNISVVKEGDSSLNLFKVNEYIYLFIQGKGLLRLQGDTFEQLPSGSFFADKEIIDILPYDNQLLVKTQNESDFFIVDNLTSRSFSSEAGKIISEL